MQITEHVHGLRLPFQVPIGPGRAVDRFVYVYLLYGREICLIDTGVATARPEIYAYLERTGRSPREISRIVLTHSHPDHLGAARVIQQETGCLVAGHPAEQAWMEDTDLQARERPVPGFEMLVGGSVRLDRLLQEGDRLLLEEELSLRVLHTPGHSPGSISLLLEQEGVLFCGDAVPLPGDFPIYTDAAASARSVQRLRETEGINVLLSSWDEPRQGAAVLQGLTESLRHLQQLHQLVRGLAGEESSPQPLAFCEQMVGELGLPAAAVNPLVARSFLANLQVRQLADLLESAA